MYLWTCEHSEDSDQTARSRSLIWIFTGRIWIAKDAKILHADNGISDCEEAQADSSLRLAHISEGYISDVSAHFVWRYTFNVSNQEEDFLFER